MAAGVHDGEVKRRSCFHCHCRHSSWPWEETLNSHIPYHRQLSMKSKEGQHHHWKATCNTQLRAYVSTACIWTCQVNPPLACFQWAHSLGLNKTGCRNTCIPDLVTVAKWRLKDSKPSNVDTRLGLSRHLSYCGKPSIRETLFTISAVSQFSDVSTTKHGYNNVL